MINTLFQSLFRLFNKDENSSPDDVKILLCGPTGKASFNIGGQTLHSAFHLPTNQKNLNELSPNVSNLLSNKLHKLKLLIIDEISMVGQHTLDMVDQRLRHLFNKHKPFGGISVITVGDFHKLRPVFARALFHPHSVNSYHEIFSQTLWHKFKIFELTTIMRQRNKKIQTALNNIARGTMTERDIKLFRSRRVNEKRIPPAAIHLFAKNKDVDAFNTKILGRMKGKETICEA